MSIRNEAEKIFDRYPDNEIIQIIMQAIICKQALLDITDEIPNLTGKRQRLPIISAIWNITTKALRDCGE